MRESEGDTTRLEKTATSIEKVSQGETRRKQRVRERSRDINNWAGDQDVRKESTMVKIHWDKPEAK